MKPIQKMTRAELEHLINTGDDEGREDEALDELERRYNEEETRDWTEADKDAVWSERYKMWRNEF